MQTELVGLPEDHYKAGQQLAEAALNAGADEAMLLKLARSLTREMREQAANPSSYRYRQLQNDAEGEPIGVSEFWRSSADDAQLRIDGFVFALVNIMCNEKMAASAAARRKLAGGVWRSQDLAAQASFELSEIRRLHVGQRA
jgi:hypothetical protein